MRWKSSGQAGLVIILLVLLAIASLAILNFRSRSDSPPSSEEKPADPAQHFKDEVKKIEESQQQREKLPEIPQ